MGSVPDAEGRFSYMKTTRLLKPLPITYFLYQAYAIDRQKGVCLPTLGLGLSTISKPFTSRAQFSCSSAAHGTVKDIVWMNPAITSKGASAVSRSSLRDYKTRWEPFLVPVAVIVADNNFWFPFLFTLTKNAPKTVNFTQCIPIYRVVLVQVTQCLGRDQG